MHFSSQIRPEEMRLNKDAPEELHWREAAILASFRGTEPIWNIALPDVGGMNRLRLLARNWLDQETQGHQLLERHLVEYGHNRFRNFVANWMVTDFIVRRATDEIITELCFVTRREPKAAKFWAEMLSIPDIGLYLAQDRKKEDDEQILSAIDNFEVSIAKGGSDAWEESIVARMTFDPSVDLTYSICRGYNDRSHFESLKKKFSQKFDLANFRVVLDRYQKLFGPLNYAGAWESLIK